MPVPHCRNGSCRYVRAPTSFSIFDSYDMKSLWFRLVMISSLALKWPVFKVEITIFWLFYEMKLKISKIKAWHFEDYEDINFKSQALHIIRIKYWKAAGSDNPSFLIPALWNIGILLPKQANRTKHFDNQWTPLYYCVFLHHEVEKMKHAKWTQEQTC